ncbi:hypothetical protein Nepgr_033555 [Nepenthes gracilis]|uniref:Uncharacterized protein n=1 Tax=Nepenthes gracilis TaxID=150966 RepID=A0AAD3Y916_NEPGR|nr:hypothetical protein Nepgr_033555 [Nepenthes gracilis]
MGPCFLSFVVVRCVAVVYWPLLCCWSVKILVLMTVLSLAEPACGCDELLSCLLLMRVPAENADVLSCLLDILYPICLGCMDGERLFDVEAG